MNVELTEFLGLIAAMKDLGYLDDSGQPTQVIFTELAEREADNLVMGYQEIFGDACGLEFVRDLMEEFVVDEDAQALCTLLTFTYDRSGNELPDHFLWFDRDERVVLFCDSLVDALDRVL